MPFNAIKKYNDLLELNSLTEHERKDSLKVIFDRDIADNDDFTYNLKIIRPLKKEGVIDVESLFKHLTYKTEDTVEKGKVIKKRDVFDFERSKRIHWILPHIKKKTKDAEVVVFSSLTRIRGKNVTRTYIHNRTEDYVIILEPQRSGLDYYLITAYYLEKRYGGHKTISKKYKNRLPQTY